MKCCAEYVEALYAMSRRGVTMCFLHSFSKLRRSKGKIEPETKMDTREDEENPYPEHNHEGPDPKLPTAKSRIRTSMYTSTIKAPTLQSTLE